MNLEELINKHSCGETIPLFINGDGSFSGPDGIKGKWSDYKEDQNKILLISDDGIMALCPRTNLVDEQTVKTDQYRQNRMTKDRYDLDVAYTESFFGWGDNATQQKILAEYFVPKIIKEFQPQYVLDIGCGSGQWLDEYRKHNVKTKGVEGSSNAWATMSEETKEVVTQCDLRDTIHEEDWTIDFAQSFEVAEHIEEEYADVFLHNLVKDDPDVILFTAAPSGQEGGGIQHVNCQDKEYWMKKMKDIGYLFSQDLLNKINSWGEPDNCPFWWHSNLMVFV